MRPPTSGACQLNAAVAGSMKPREPVASAFRSSYQYPDDIVTLHPQFLVEITKRDAYESGPERCV